MLILITNDDGIESPGLDALADQLSAIGEVVVVAPADEQSAKSHALTMHEPLRVRRRGPGRFSVSGTPVDCVYIGVHHICDRRPDVVLSGINRGTNLGDDVHYSGTVAGAREGSLVGLPSLAVSLEARPDRRDRDRHWDTAARLARHVVTMMKANGLPPRTFLNLNVPDVPPDKLTRLHVTRLGRNQYEPLVRVGEDPRGRSYYWLGGEHKGYSVEEGTDGYWFSRGHPTLTPLWTEATALELVEKIGRWKVQASDEAE